MPVNKFICKFVFFFATHCEGAKKALSVSAKTREWSIAGYEETYKRYLITAGKPHASRSLPIGNAGPGSFLRSGAMSSCPITSSSL